jgi:hypothetical protein
LGDISLTAQENDSPWLNWERDLDEFRNARSELACALAASHLGNKDIAEHFLDRSDEVKSAVSDVVWFTRTDVVKACSGSPSAAPRAEPARSTLWAILDREAKQAADARERLHRADAAHEAPDAASERIKTLSERADQELRFAIRASPFSVGEITHHFDANSRSETTSIVEDALAGQAFPPGFRFATETTE